MPSSCDRSLRVRRRSCGVAGRCQATTRTSQCASLATRPATEPRIARARKFFPDRPTMMRSALAARAIFQELLCRVAFLRHRADVGSARPRGDCTGIGQQVRGLVARFDERLGTDAIRLHLRPDRNEDHLAARSRGSSALCHGASRGVRAVVADHDAALGCSSFDSRFATHPAHAPVARRGGGAAGVQLLASPLGFDVVAVSRAGAAGALAGSVAAGSSARVTRHSALIPDAVVASVTSRRWWRFRRLRRRSRPRATRRALARV
jgi:hypothetical protein